MALNWRYVRYLDQQGMIRPGTKLLDIGSSNLYAAPADGVYDLLRKHAPNTPAAEHRVLADRLAAGSGKGADGVALNQSWVGELFEACGMEYVAFDIAPMYKTELLDFNHQGLPPEHRGRYDVILNFGTTEHVLNQFNSFRIIHEAAKPGTLTWHQLPSAGYVDHCYFSYHPRFFFDLAGYNRYELVNFWFTAGGGSPRFSTLADYASHFPVLGQYLADPASRPEPAENVAEEDACINVIYRKVHEQAFLGALEPSTAAATVAEAVMLRYTHDRPAAPAPAVGAAMTPAPRPPFVRAMRRLLRPVLKPIRDALRKPAAR
jgi:hypothetical protein